MIEVGKTREGRFLIIFLLQYLTFSGFLAYHEVTAIPTDAITTMLAILLGMASLGFLSALNTVVFVEGSEMLVEKYLRRRYQAGKAEGRSEAWHEWQEWNHRRLEAEKQGRPFTEPPPPLNNHANQVNS